MRLARPFASSRAERGRRPRAAAVARRPQQRSLDTRQRILEAALRQFAEHGYDGAMTRDIATAAGVQQPLINYHFGSKRGLWQESVSLVFGELRQALADTVRHTAEAEPLETLRVILRALVRFNARRPELNGIMIKEAAAHTERLEWVIDAHVGPTFEAMQALLREVQASGALGAIPPVPLYYLIIGAASSVFIMAPAYRMLSSQDPFDPDRIDEYADAVVHLFLGTALRAADARRPSRARSRR